MASHSNLAAIIVEMLRPRFGRARQASGRPRVPDLYFEYEEFGSRRQLFVETKDRPKPLGRADVSKIWWDYASDVRAGSAELLLVTSNGITRDAAAFIAEHPPFHHLSLDQLREVYRSGGSAPVREGDASSPGLAGKAGSAEASANRAGQAPYVIGEKRKAALLHMLDQLELKLDGVRSNEVKAQASAYIVAARALLEAPDPQSDLVWEILTRANNLAGIGSFFLAALALLVATGG